MKTKLPSGFITWLGYVLNLKNSFILLFLLLFTMSSFGQEITFTCGVNTISFTGPPDVPMIGDYPSWSEGRLPSDPVGWFWTLEVQDTSGTLQWSVVSPTEYGSGHFRYFYVVVDATVVTPCDDSVWVDDLSGCTPGVTCSGDFDLYFDPDNDGDGYPASVDCNDEDADVNPGATEICHDTIDNDCDGFTDEDDAACGEVISYCNADLTKVLICHNGKNKCVQSNALDAHIAHGDTLGSCDGDPYQDDLYYSKSNAGKPDTSVEGFNVRVWPNPSESNYNIKIATADNLNAADVQVIDITGKLVHNAHINWNENYKFGSDLESGVYFVKITQGNNTQVKKVIKR